MCLQYRGKSDISNSVMSGCITGGLIGLRGEYAMNVLVKWNCPCPDECVLFLQLE